MHSNYYRNKCNWREIDLLFQYERLMLVPKTETMQYIVLFSQRTVQLPSVVSSQKQEPERDKRSTIVYD